MKKIIVVLMLLAAVPSGPAYSAEPRWLEEDAESPEVDAAAQAALEKLGPERGAVGLIAGFDGGEIYIEGADTGGIEIIGLGEDTVGVPLDLKGLISDLNADLTDYGYKISLSGDVLFEFDKADLKPESKQTLEKVVILAKKEKAAEVRVEGHTDSKGGEDYNQDLSKRRAESVKLWLVLLGKIEADIVKAIGLGESAPVAENAHPDGSDNPEGRALNRRVDIYVKKTK